MTKNKKCKQMTKTLTCLTMIAAKIMENVKKYKKQKNSKNELELNQVMKRGDVQISGSNLSKIITFEGGGLSSAKVG